MTTHQTHTTHTETDPEPPVTHTWKTITTHVTQALGMYRLGDHKLYLTMDQGQEDEMRSYGTTRSDPDLATLKRWWDESCPLRFITLLYTMKDGDVDDPRCFEQFVEQGDEIV